MPVVRVLHSQSPEAFPDALRDLKDAGYVEGENVAIEYRRNNARLVPDHRH